MEEITRNKIIKCIKMDSGEEVRMSVELVNISEKNNTIAKDFLETMFKEIKALF